MSKLKSIFQSTYDQLNTAQKEAVDAIDGPLLVLAGPGTGKTQVLALRIANIIAKTDTPPQAILALTFTESGAREMRERLVRMIGAEGYYPVLSTFHSLGTAIIREHPEKFLFAEESEPLTELDRIQIMTQILDKNEFEHIRPLGKPYLYLKSLIKSIQDLKREGYEPETFEKFLLLRHSEPVQDSSLRDQNDKVQILKLIEVQKVFKLYENELSKRDSYDFEDMINKVVEKLNTDEELLLEYQEKFHYFLADEYQDTNSAQNALLFKLASYWGQQANIMVVGDPDQSIFRFQGASLENILEFENSYPNAKIIKLKENYRSQQTILDAVHGLISNNKIEGHSEFISESKRKNTALISQTSFDRVPVKLASFPSSTVEYAFVGHKIRKLLESGVSASEIAVIYRDNFDAGDLADMLGRLSIKYNLEGGDDVLRSGNVVRLLTLMRTIVGLRNKTEDLDLFTLLNYEFWNTDKLDTLKMARFASERKCNFLEAIYHREVKLAELNDLSKIKSILEQLQTWGKLDGQLAFVELFEKIINESGLLNWVLKQPNVTRKLNQLNSFFHRAKLMNSSDHQLDLTKFLQAIDLMTSNRISVLEDDLDIDMDAVRLSTAHKVKGKEFEYVFIVKAYDGKWGNKRVPELIKLPKKLVEKVSSKLLNDPAIFPNSESKEDDERRLFYVALTRTKKECFVTWSVEYDTKKVVPAMFIEEIPKSCKQLEDTADFQLQVNEILKEIFTPLDEERISPKEEDWLKQVLSDFKLNPTALNTYLECGYKFKLNQLLRTPSAKPEPMAFGTAVHAALEKFFKKYQESGDIPSVNYLLTVFEQALAKETMVENSLPGWIKRGDKALRLYMSYYLDELKPPVVTEKFFGSKFNPVMLDDIPLSGKIDKVELLNPKLETRNSKLSVRVVDYKTGKPKSRNEIEGNTKNSNGDYKRQLVFYQLLAELDKTFKYEVKETQLDFVEANDSGKLKKETFVVTPEEVFELKNLIKETMNKIRKLEFTRTTDYLVCEMCQYQRHCWPEGVPNKIQS